MDYECKILVVAEQPIMSIRGRTTLDRLTATIGEYLTEVWNHLEKQGVKPAGQPFTRYHGMGGDVIELEAGLPVSAPLPSRGRIHAGRLPGGEAAVTTHVGSYDGLITAGEALSAWVEKQGRNASGPNWEVYVTDPGREPDPARWRTDVYQPLV